MKTVITCLGKFGRLSYTFDPKGRAESSEFEMKNELPRISAILLAAGASKRFGGPKLLLPLGNSTILERSVDNLLGSKVSEVIVVIGYRAHEVGRVIADKPVKIVVNRFYRQGMSTSLRVGLGMVSKHATAIMIALADLPFIPTAAVDTLIEAFRHNNKGIIVPLHDNRRGHPVIFSIKYQGELSQLTGDMGGREIIGRHSDDMLEVAVDSESIYRDIDTMMDYKSYMKSNVVKT